MILVILYIIYIYNHKNGIYLYNLYGEKLFSFFLLCRTVFDKQCIIDDVLIKNSW